MAQLQAPARVLKAVFLPHHHANCDPSISFQPRALAWDAHAMRTRVPQGGHHGSISPTINRSETTTPICWLTHVSSPLEGPSLCPHEKGIENEGLPQPRNLKASENGHARGSFPELSRTQVWPLIGFKDLLSHTCKHTANRISKDQCKNTPQVCKCQFKKCCSSGWKVQFVFLPVGKLYRTSLAQAQGHNLPPKGTWLGRATGSVSTQGGGGASRGQGTVLGSGKTVVVRRLVV